MTDGAINGLDEQAEAQAADADARRQEMARSMTPDLRRLAPNLVVAGVLPLIAYALLRPHVSSDAVALAAVMVFPLAEIAFERLRRGRFEPIGIIALVGIAAGLAGALIFHGDTFLLKMRDSVVTGAFGVLCLASLPLARPAMFYVARTFATAGDADRQALFDEMAAAPGAMQRFRLVTLVWGVGLVAEAASRTVFAMTLSTGVFLVVAQVVNYATIGLLLGWTIQYRRRQEERLRVAA